MPSIKGRAVHVVSANGPLELVEREFREPGSGEVRVRIDACGVCHSDSITKMGLFPGIEYPRVPGHEIAGVIDAVGPGMETWKADTWQVGDRVGVGWFGGNCGHCESCRRGDFITCENMLIPGISYDGGYADYTVVPVSALALIPGDLAAVDAGPLMCAGITTFNALRHSGARAGDVVAILGIGGLGHLGVQFAAKMGFHTVAIARGEDKAELAKKLGAHVYIDTKKQDAAAELNKLGGARVVLATVTDAPTVSAIVPGLGANGHLVVVGVAAEPMQISSLDLVMKSRTVSGWPSGTSKDSEDTLDFSALTGIRPSIEEYPLEKAAEGFDRMMSGKARFRVVLKMK